MAFHPEMTDRERAEESAGRLISLLEMHAPEIIIGREWALLWRHMTNAFGSELLERGEDDMADGWKFDEETNN